MKETKFIEQNKEKWSEFETLLQNKSKDPDRLSDLYVQLTDDLSYSKTYYKNRLVRAYLNNISQKVYLSIYKTKKTIISVNITAEINAVSSYSSCECSVYTRNIPSIDTVYGAYISRASSYRACR